MPDILDDLKYEDLNESLKFLLDITDMETIKILLRDYSGERFYIPKNFRAKLAKRFIYNKLRNNQLINRNTIARDLNLSVNYVSVLIRKVKESM